MATAEHTPGPWTARAFSSVVGCPITAQPDPTKNTINVAGAHGSQHDSAADRRAEVEANARLIAAAPDLLEALKGLLPEGWGDDDTMDQLPGVKAARAAIAQAEGRA